MKNKKKINLKNSLFIIISKSGNTLETLINTNLFKDKINQKYNYYYGKKNIIITFLLKKKILLIEHKIILEEDIQYYPK